jgi:hypothetical protein
MTIRTLLNLSASAVLAIGAGLALAQAPPGPPPVDLAKMRADLEAYDKQPDTVGSGKYPALKEMVSSLPNHVIYRPADLSSLGREKLGVLAWGNGACSADGAGARFHLSEIASHGYLAIASGTILTGPGSPPHAGLPIPMPIPGEPGPGQPGFKVPPPATKAGSLTEAIDWALAENKRPGSPYFRRINPHWIAVSGWSCGGLQAIQIAADPRVRTVIIHNSGLFPKGAGPSPEVDIGKAPLSKLHTSILYVLGGPTDIAYINGMDDFSRIDNVPAMVVNIDVGHAGTFLEPNGGRAASVAASWLDWQFKGDPTAAKLFTGKDCGLCEDPLSKVERKKIN